MPATPRAATTRSKCRRQERKRAPAIGGLPRLIDGERDGRALPGSDRGEGVLLLAAGRRAVGAEALRAVVEHAEARLVRVNQHALADRAGVPDRADVDGPVGADQLARAGDGAVLEGAVELFHGLCLCRAALRVCRVRSLPPTQAR